MLRVQVQIDDEDGDRRGLAIQKLFHVLFANGARSGSTQISCYTGLVFSADSWATGYPRLALSVTLNGQPMQVTDANLDEFYTEASRLQPYWGQETQLVESGETLVQKVVQLTGQQVEPQVQEMLFGLLHNLKNRGSFPIIIEERRKNIGPLIALPEKPRRLSTNRAEVYLSDEHVAIAAKVPCRMHVLCWTCLEGMVDLEIRDGRLYVEFEAEWNSLAKGYDVKFYFLLPNSTTITDQRGYLKVAGTGSQEGQSTDLDVVAFYTQHRIEYFREWLRRGVQQSALFGIRSSAATEEILRCDGQKRLRATFWAVNQDIVRLRYFREVLFNLWIAAMLTIGLDATRMQRVKDSLPLGQQLGGEVWWTVMCASLIPGAFLLAKRRAMRKFTKLALVTTYVCFGLWSLLFLLLPSVGPPLFLWSTWVSYGLVAAVFSGGAITLAANMREVP